MIGYTALVQLLQRAKDTLHLQSALLKLDKYELPIVDDIGYAILLGYDA